MHIISTLHLKKTSCYDKYNEYKGKIKYCIWSETEHGYILRELLSESSVYDLILSSNSELSKSFKCDVARILTNLRKSGLITFGNNGIRLVTNEHPRAMEK